MSDSVAVIICYSRCLWCGRRTPHECCHAHATELGFDPESVADIDALWGSAGPEETCTDPACPVWEPGEWDRIQAEAALTPGQRRERLERIQQGIAERRANRTEV
jgi:hypothetical protein